LVLAFAVRPTPGLEVDLLLKVDECVQLRVYLKDDIAALAAATTSRAAPRYKFLSPKGNGSVAAVARLYVDFGFIKEHNLRSYGRKMA
jgi:hypothetical protein